MNNNIETFPMNLSLCFTFVGFLSLAASLTVDGEYQFKLPDRIKSQGKVELEYKSEAEIMKHQLTFTETLDSKEQKCKLSIGYVSYEPTTYFASKEVAALSETGGICKQVNHPSSLVPELSWFADKIIGSVDTKPVLNKNPHLIGPSGLLMILNEMTNETNYFSSGQVECRNMICDLWTREFTSHDRKLHYKLEVYLIDLTKSSNSNSLQDDNVSGKQKEFDNGFTIRVTIVSDPKVEVKFTAILTIDMFDELIFDSRSLVNEASDFDYEFNVPLGSGCSQFLPVSQKIKLHSKSFSMSLHQPSNGKNLILAYDQLGYLRIEEPGKSVSIWDISENLLYFIGQNVTQSLGSKDQPKRMKVKSCSILQLNKSETYPAALKPYDESLMSLMTFLGADRLAYMGRSRTRDLPCYVYETIVSKPPMIFASSMNFYNHDTSTNSGIDRNTDYIVQFHLVQSGSNNQLSSPDLNQEVNFWPTQISLFKRNKDQQTTGLAVEFLNSLDVDDFHWSLDGWSKKRGELFLVGECFEEDNEFRQLELGLKFNRIHNGVPKREDLILMDHSKFQLEYELVDSVSQYLKFSRFNTIEYELQFGQHQMDFSMMIADRVGDRTLEPQKRGYLGEHECIPTNDCSQLGELNEIDCLTIGSLISGSFIIAHCPSKRTEQRYFQARCMVFHGFYNPSITSNQNIVDSSEIGNQQPACQTYKLLISPKQSEVTSQLDRIAGSLKDYAPEFNFADEMSNSAQIFKGKLAHYNVILNPKIFELSNHKFIINKEDEQDEGASTSLTKSFSSVEIKNQADCARLCNLDFECRSYSFCRQTTKESKAANQLAECVVSQVDMRLDSIQKQLRDQGPVMLNTNRTKLDFKTDGGVKFQLEISAACDIFERDYLSVYSRSMETLRLTELVTKQLPPAASTFECARQAIKSESLDSNHHGAMFAYCGQTRTCIVDENLVNHIIQNKADNESSVIPVDREPDEIDCSIYRRKYHTFFHVSPKILVPNSSQLVVLNFKSIEECARACWFQFGQVCASFDYCSSSGGCSINKLGLNYTPFSGKLELTTRVNCLHYERDLRLDQLRRENLISRHEILSQLMEGDQIRGYKWSFGNLVLNSLYYLSFVVAFMLGLQTSNLFNLALNNVAGQLNVRLRRQSAAAATGGRFAKRLARFNMAARTGNNANKQDDENYDFASEDEEITTETTTAGNQSNYSTSQTHHQTVNGNIRMNVIRRNH